MKNKWLFIIGIAILFAVAYNLFFIHIDTKEEINCIKKLANKSCNGEFGEVKIIPDFPMKSTYFCNDKEQFFNKQELEECYKR